MRSGTVVVVARVGRAEGSLAAAAAIACAGSGPARAGTLVEIGAERPPRPALVATAAARRLEERLASHLPEVPLAARGGFCQLALPPESAGLELLGAALALGREATAVIHAPPGLLHETVAAARAGAGLRVVLRADLDRDRPLAGLAARALLAQGIPVSVLKLRLPWLAARRALHGVLPADAPGGLPPRLRKRALNVGVASAPG
jgi:hypothetical protein